MKHLNGKEILEILEGAPNMRRNCRVKEVVIVIPKTNLGVDGRGQETM
jgi:hypothetical protein